MLKGRPYIALHAQFPCVFYFHPILWKKWWKPRFWWPECRWKIINISGVQPSWNLYSQKAQNSNFQAQKKIRARSFFVFGIFQFEWNKSGKSWKKSLLILAPFWMAQSDWLFARINQSQAGIQNQFSTEHNFWLPWWILMNFFLFNWKLFKL